MKKLILLGISLLALSSCGSMSMPYGDKEQGWMITHYRGGGDELFYCKANATVKGATPECYQADLHGIYQR